MKVVPIQPNPFFPLPGDYERLSTEGKRQARVNGVRLWREPGVGRKERGRRYVICLDFFDRYYLWPHHDIDFDPMFYDDDPLPSPMFHDDISMQWATNRCGIAIAPRGGAKSMKVSKSVMMEMTSLPKWSCLYATSTGDNAKMVGQRLKDQFEHNQRIIDDWSPEFPDHRIVPKRGEMPFGNTHMQLMNRSYVRCVSAEGHLRGGRPKLFILDDPEYDPKAATSMELIRQYMDRLLFNIVMPMVMRKGAGVRWLATYVSKRHFAWHAMDVDGQGQARDARFNRWDRIVIRSEYEDEDGTKRSCWPEMWPATTAERLKLAETDAHYAEVVSLDEIEENIGRGAYLAEYLGRPGEGDDVFFPNLEEKKHGYWFSSVDEHLGTNPRNSESRICWTETATDGSYTHRDMALSAFLAQARLFQTVDTSYTAGPDSDSKVSTMLALTPENNLFVLDCWSAQCHQPRLVEEALYMADRWRSPVIYVEAIREGLMVYQDLYQLIATRSKEMVDVEHLPSVRKYSPGPVDKCAKISTLLRRFTYAKIKIPMRDMTNNRAIRNLMNQIGEFNPDAANGGLQHDDELDTVSMSTYILKGRVRELREEVVDKRTPIEKMKEGELEDSLGRPYMLGVDLASMTVEDVYEILAHQETKSKDAGSKV